MKKSISNVFGGEAKVKIMRLFVFNPEVFFTAAEVSRRIKSKPNVVRKELTNLTKAGLIKKLSKGYILNTQYDYLGAVENFLIDATPLSEKEIVNRISKAGVIKFILITGVFLHDKDSRVDVLVVGDDISQSKLDRAISYIEAELGKEIRYASFETPDFKYRMSIYDKLVRDILDFHHKKILNKLGI